MNTKFLLILLAVQSSFLLAAGYIHLLEPSYYGPWTQSADIQAGKKQFNAMGCQNCHGDDGLDPLADNYPVLAGQRAPYLISQMQDIKEGRRTNSFSPIMQPLFIQLTDKQINQIAAYLSSVEP